MQEPKVLVTHRLWAPPLHPPPYVGCYLLKFDNLSKINRLCMTEIKLEK